MTVGDLHSWKEIADYLGVSVRTAQKWEHKQKLPVRRMHGERGRTFALKSEIDAWKMSLDNGISATIDGQTSSAGASRLARIRPWQVALACVTPILLFAIIYWLRSLPGEPANWRVIGNALVITDARDREVWRWHSEWGIDPSWSAETNDQARHIWIGDLDGHGGNETLFFAPLTREFYTRLPLICFDRKGKEKWRFVPGREVASGREHFANLFHVCNFLVARLGQGRPNSIIVSAIHVPDYPCQISLLDVHTGLPVREYWHSGYIGQHTPWLVAADLDGNGISEICLGGISQAPHRFTLVALDPDRFEGASYEEDPDYQLRGFPSGREISRAIIPNSCLNPGLGEGMLGGIYFAPDSIFVQMLESVSERATLDYYFSRTGKFLKMSPSDAFRLEHEAAERTGRIDHPFTPEEHRALEKSVIVLPPSYELAVSGTQNSKGRTGVAR